MYVAANSNILNLLWFTFNQLLDLPIPTVPEFKTQSLLQLSAFTLYVVVKPSQLPSLLYAQFGYGVNFGD